MIYVLICLITGSKLAGFLSYNEFANSNFNENCDKEEICNHEGPRYLLSSLVLSALGSLVVLLVIKYRNRKDDILIYVDGLENSVSIIGSKVVPVILIGTVFLGLSMSWDWVSYQTPTTYKGGILTLDEIFGIKNLMFNCISGPKCAMNSALISDQRLCNSFDKLYYAGRVYYWLISMTLLFLCLWLENLYFVIKKIQFGILMTNYLWPILTSMFSLISIGSWFYLSEVSYGADCRVKAGDPDTTFCAEEGPTFGLISIVCYFFAAIFYCLLYTKRSSLNPKTQIHPNFRRKLSSSNISKIILEYPSKQNNECSITKDFIDEDVIKPYQDTPRISKRPQTVETTNSDLILNHEDSLEQICLSCGTE